MTMPHLMNCPHSDEGWCLDCVKKLHDEKESKKVEKSDDHSLDYLINDGMGQVDENGKVIGSVRP